MGQTQTTSNSTGSRVLNGLGDMARGTGDIFRTRFGVDLALRPILDARKIEDARMDHYDKMAFSTECRYVFGVDPIKTFSEFVRDYDGKKSLVIYLLERLKAEKTPLKHQIFVPRTDAENIEESYYSIKGMRLVPFDGLWRK